MATTVGSGSYQYELNESWARLPAGPVRSRRNTGGETCPTCCT
jgi:hypothetical protein